MNNLMVSWLHSSSSSLHCSLVIKSCPTLGTLRLVAHQASLSMGFSRQESWSGLPFPSPGDLFHPGIEPKCPALQVDSLPTELQGNTPHYRWHSHHFPLDAHLCLASLLTKQNCFLFVLSQLLLLCCVSNNELCSCLYSLASMRNAFFFFFEKCIFLLGTKIQGNTASIL